jgi:dTDP-4-dehydrorhamnose 3,5-epimerase
MKIPFAIKTKIFNDNRGYFKELFLTKKFKFNLKFTACSISKKGVIRGLHYQIKKPQEKIISILFGRAIDICVNIDKSSENFGKIYKFNLSPGLMLYVPKGYAHGISFLNKYNILLYHLSEYRYPDYEKGIYPLDKNLKINWMVKKPILSPRDKKHPLFDQINFNEI